MNQPKVSVIIPVYNAEKYLRECLDSVANQTLKDIEIICVDDGSTDNSLTVLREYEARDKRVTVLTQNNQFAGVARNNGMEHARGQYYMFLDADDFFAADMLERMYAQTSACDADICLCRADFYNTQARQFRKMPWCLNLREVKKQPFSSADLKDIFQVAGTEPWTKLFSANFIRQHNLQFQDTPRNNDLYFTYCGMALAQKIVYVNKVLVHYRVGQDSNLQSGLYKTPTVCCDVWLAVKNRLEVETCWKDVKDAFLGAAAENLGYNVWKLKDYPETRSVLIKEITNRTFQALGLRGCPLEIMVDQKSYQTECPDADEIRVCAECIRIWMQWIPEPEREDAFKRFWEYRCACPGCKRLAAPMTGAQAAALYEAFSSQEKREIIIARKIDTELMKQLGISNSGNKSISYRLGRTITWLPRKVRGGVHCFRDHGAGYTVRRALYHMGLWKDEEKG